jgi:hypothetical protein
MSRTAILSEARRTGSLYWDTAATLITMFAASALLVLGISATNAASTTKAKTTPAHSPESIECSKRADAKGLHGENERNFALPARRS